MLPGAHPPGDAGHDDAEPVFCHRTLPPILFKRLLAQSMVKTPMTFNRRIAAGFSSC
jgi:hypothetical protein